MIKNIFLLFLALPLLVSGCASTPADYDTGLVFPKSNGTYEIVGEGYSESEAVSNALYQAKKVCKELAKRYIVLDRSLTYHGVLTREANKLERSLDETIGNLTDSYIPSTGSSEDYKSTLITKCE